MDVSVQATAITSGAVMFGGLMTLIGVYLTKQQTAKAAEANAVNAAATAEAENTKADSAAIVVAQGVWESAINRLITEMAGQRADMAEQKVEIAQLHLTVAGYENQVRDLNRRLDDMERQRTGDVRTIAAWAAYVRRIWAICATAELAIPPLPDGLSLDPE